MHVHLPQRPHPPCRRIWTFACTFALLQATALPLLGAPGPDWPLYRSDLNLTRHNSGKGKLATPVLRWRAFLGGGPVAPRALDANLDGVDDVLAIEGGAVSARGWNGKVLWKTGPISATKVLAVAQLNDDPYDEIVVRVAGGVRVLSAVNGASLWSSPAGMYPKLGVIHVADFNGDGRADVAMADVGGSQSAVSGALRIYSLVGTPSMIASTPDLIDGAKARGDLLRLTDVDGDGLPDIYMPVMTVLAKGTVYVFSGKTGKLIGKSDEIDRVSCDRPVSLPQKTGSPLVLCTNTFAEILGTLSLRGAYAASLSGDKLVRKWQYLVPDESKDRFHGGFVGDVEGDGQLELVATEWVAGAWRLRILDVLTGKSVGELAGSVPWLGQTDIKADDTLRLGGQGPGLILCRVGDDAIDGVGAEVRLISWTRKDGFSSFATLGKGAGALVWASENGSADPANRPAPATTFALGGTDMDLLLRSDSDGDMRFDRVEVLHVSAAAKVTKLAGADFGMQPFVGPILTTSAGRHVLISTPDGQSAVMAADMKLLNDPDGDGDANLIYGAAAYPRLLAARVNAADATPRVLASEGGRLRVYDLSAASPTLPPKVTLDLGEGADAVYGNLIDLDGDGSRELVVRSRSNAGSGVLDAYGTTGTKLWSYVHPGGVLRWSVRDGGLFGPIPAGKGHDLLVGLIDPNVSPSINGRVTLVSGATGKSKWAPGAACSGFEAMPFAFDGDAAEPAAIFSIYGARMRCRVSDGAVIAQVSHTVPRYGAPMLVDLDGDGARDVVIGEGFAGLGAERAPGFTTIWNTKGNEYYHRPATLFAAGKELLVATLVNADPEIRVFDARTGKLAWKQRYAAGSLLDAKATMDTLPLTSGLISVADLVGDGKPSLLFTTSDGWLYAVSALNGAVRWSSDWGGKIGDPIVADLDGDGEVEILFSSPDGYLNALDHDVLGALAWVRENDGSGPATTPADDIDSQEDSELLHVNWASLAGAQGYAVQVADQQGAVVVPMTQVGAGTAVTFDDLNLQLGHVYRSEVRGWIDGTAGKQYSLPTLSDGVTIVDLSAPEITGLKAEPPGLNTGGSTVIRATLIDATRLAAVEVDVVDAEGTVVAHWQRPLAVRKHDLDWTWKAASESGAPVPAGAYSVTVTARDGAGHVGKFGINVLVCAVDEVVGVGVCLEGGGDVVDAGASEDGGASPDAGTTADVTSPDAGAPDVTGTDDGLNGADVSSTATAEAGNPSDPDNCCSAAPVPGLPMWPVLLFAVVLLAYRRRRT